MSERVAPREWTPEPCALERCGADGSRLREGCYYGTGTAICHHGPWRNYDQQVERRGTKQDRRAAPTPETERKPDPTIVLKQMASGRVGYTTSEVFRVANRLAAEVMQHRADRTREALLRPSPEQEAPTDE